MKKTLIALLALAFTAALVLPALAEDSVPAATGQQAQNAEAKTPLRTEIIKLKYVRAQDIQNLLYAYVSREGHIQVNNNLPNILTVSDAPENVEKILAAVREIDVKPADVLYTVQLVLGSETDATTDPELKNDLVIKELGKLLRYKGYTLLDATFVRVVNRDRAQVVLGPKAEFGLELRPDVAADPKAPMINTKVTLMQTVREVKTTTSPEGKEIPLQGTTSTTIPIQSTLNIKSGDRTVVGVSKLDGGDKGLILIISAKIVD
jgi:type II secretory pathway component GspD/PulD (secretin)